MKILNLLLLAGVLFAKDEFFFEKPYLQLGNRPTAATKGALDLMWLGHDKDVDFTVEYKTTGTWQKATPKMLRRVEFGITPAHRVYSAALEKLESGVAFTYRVSVAGKKLVEESSTARKGPSDNTHFVVTGDAAANTAGQRQVAFQVSLQKPDYLFVAGDIVYSRGRVAEYQTNFWPVYNSDLPASPLNGAPIARTTLFTGVIGNHDSQMLIDFTQNPDPLAFYHYWALPTNGPAVTTAHKFVPQFMGDPALKEKYLQATKGSFPNMATYSFDYGNVHWTVIDSNNYVDWTDPEFRKWVADDLKSASKAKWRMVGFHHPPFNSSVAHFREQRLRVMTDIFEQGKVDLVLAGHVHNYQRTFPMTFKVDPGFDLSKSPEVPGKWTFDKTFDGDKNTHPKAPIYIITGAGGANLYNVDQTYDPATWQPFTDRFVSNIHSFSVIDTTATKLTFKQISAEGKELDRFVITR